MRTLWTDERPKEQNCGQEKPRRRLALIPVGMTSALRSGVCVSACVCVCVCIWLRASPSFATRRRGQIRLISSFLPPTAPNPRANSPTCGVFAQGTRKTSSVDEAMEAEDELLLLITVPSCLLSWILPSCSWLFMLGCGGARAWLKSKEREPVSLELWAGKTSRWVKHQP